MKIDDWGLVCNCTKYFNIFTKSQWVTVTEKNIKFLVTLLQLSENRFTEFIFSHSAKAEWMWEDFVDLISYFCISFCIYLFNSLTIDSSLNQIRDFAYVSLWQVAIVNKAVNHQSSFREMFKMNNSNPVHIAQCPALEPRKTPITDEYEISNNVLGLGINGKVVECIKKSNGIKFALKVSMRLS